MIKMKTCAILFVFLSSTFTNVFAERTSEADTTTTQRLLDEISVVGLYRSGAGVGDIIDRDFLQKQNKGQEPSFILRKWPSIFSYSDTGNEYGYAYFRMRGMDQTRVNMTMDGMPLNEGEDMGVYFSNYPDVLSSMHSVNIVSGASISGNGVAGYAGRVDFESVDLYKDTLSSVYFGCGSFNTFKSTLEYNSGHMGKWAVHFKANSQQSDGFRDHAYNNSQSAFAKVGYSFNDHHTIDLLSFVGQSRNGQGWIGSNLEDIAINKRVNGCSEAETDKFVQNINKLQYKGGLDDHVILSASVYYNQLKGHYYFDVDNYMKKIWSPDWQSTDEIDCYNLRHHMLGANIASKIYWDCFALTSGVNAYTFNRRHIGTCNISNEQLWDNKGYKNDINAFVKGEYDCKRLKLTGNLQYRHADFDYKGDVPFNKINWDFMNWSSRICYQLNKEHNIYAMATQTHREPTRSDMFGGNENLTELVTTQAESVIDYELGYNASNSRMKGNLNLFYMDFSNELILNGAMGTNGLPIMTNTAKSYRTGVELNLTYEPIERLALRNTTSYAINKVKAEDDVFNHAMSPNWLVNQSASYRFGKMEVGVDMNYRSKMYFDLANQYVLKSSTQFGALATYTYNALTFSLNVNNIFNQRCYSNGMLGASGPLYFIEAPRNFHFGVRWIL